MFACIASASSKLKTPEIANRQNDGTFVVLIIAQQNQGRWQHHVVCVNVGYISSCTKLVDTCSRSLEICVHGDHLPGKLGRVGELKEGQRNLRELTK